MGRVLAGVLGTAVVGAGVLIGVQSQAGADAPNTTPTAPVVAPVAVDPAPAVTAAPPAVTGDAAPVTEADGSTRVAGSLPGQTNPQPQAAPTQTQAERQAALDAVGGVEVSAPQSAQDVESYWTPERRATAVGQ